MKTGNCEKFLSVNFLSGRLPLLCAAWIACLIYSSVARADERLEFFEKRIRPVLIEHCYRCHSADAEELRGGLRLDTKSGWQQGGDSGQRRLSQARSLQVSIRSIEHAEGIAAMPPMQAKLADSVIADLKKWVENGALILAIKRCRRARAKLTGSPPIHSGLTGGACNRSSLYRYLRLVNRQACRATQAGLATKLITLC